MSNGPLSGLRVVVARPRHQAAALVRFGSVCDNVLTCGLHGWEYELPSGKCITTDGVLLRVKGRVEHPEHD